MLSIATVVQNERAFLSEWLEYHRLPHLGVREFLLYDDGSTDDLRGLTRPYRAEGTVRLFSTDALRPWNRTTLLKTHVCAFGVSFPRWVARAPFEHWCERVEPFPQQIAMLRHALGAARTEFVAFVDADEYLVMAGAAPLDRWLGALPDDVGGVAVSGRVMLSKRDASPLLNESEQLAGVLDLPVLSDKCVVRRSAAHPATVGTIHEVALADGMRYVRDPSVSLVHYRYRAFDARFAKRYVTRGSGDPGVGRRAKLRKLTLWRQWRRTALRRKEYVHYVGALPHALRAWRAAAQRLGRPLPPRAGVVIVAEARSGSSWFAQRVFGARPDVLYVYEPCRAVPHTRGTGIGSWFDDECVHVLRELLDCATPLAAWKQMKQDKHAVRMSTPGAFASYHAFSALCQARHVVLKTVRVHDPAPLATAACAVVHLERNASEVLASRARRGRRCRRDSAASPRRAAAAARGTRRAA